LNTTEDRPVASVVRELDVNEACCITWEIVRTFVEALAAG
jgi:hypothetical protein